jgi:IS30 family transposase
MARRGRKRRLDAESLYWQLILSGVGTVEACHEVGIGRKTGYRWRAENGGLPPGRLAEEVRSGRYLSRLERQRIATLHRQGLGVRAIAVRLGRAPSAVSRELRRNMRPHDQGSYDGDLAHARARERARRPRRGRLLDDAGLRAEVQAKLELEWSPEQIAAHLRRAYPGRPGWHVCHETIYQALYHGGKGGLSRQLTKKLRTGRPLRKRRRRPDQRRTRFTTPAVLIDLRPEQALGRQRIGDWEGDLIIGRSSQSAIGTLVDRSSRYVRLIHLPASHDAPAVRDGLITILAGLPEAARITLTWDQGSEMALMTRSHPCSAKACSSPTRPAPGSGERMRTPIGARLDCRGSSDGRGAGRVGRVTPRTRAARLAVDMSTGGPWREPWPGVT